MANLAIRFLMLQLLASSDLTVTAIAERIGAVRNSVAKSMEKAHEHGIVHIAGYDKRIPLYRRGPGQDAPRPPAEKADAPEAKPAPPVVPVPYAGIEYFEIVDLLPGVQHFMCTKLKSTLSVASCGDRYQKAMAGGAENDRYFACRSCPIGAAHSGKEAPNESRFFGKTICGRRHTGATRLIGKHLCISCYNRSREYLIGRNRKGTKPVKLARLDPRSITYLAGDAVKTRALDLTVDTEELVIAALRDESSRVAFGFKSTAMHALFDGEQFDRSIEEMPSEGMESRAVAPAHVVGAQTDVEFDGSRATAELEVLPADPYAALREAVEHMDRDPLVYAPGLSRRAAKKQRQKARRQVRVSNVTVNLLRNIGALPTPAPAIVPA